MNLDFVRMLAIAIVGERLGCGWGTVGARLGHGMPCPYSIAFVGKG